MTLRCQMDDACTAPVTHIDRKGYIYCAAHGPERRLGHGVPCRKLTPAELKRLQAGEPLKKY